MSIASSAGATDAGRKRRRNEDNFVCEPPLFAVADGMGGAQAGELASQLAAASLRERSDGGSGEDYVIDLIQSANRAVYERAHSDQSVSGMGTTITVALAEEGFVRVGHVGDSRLYLIRDGHLEQETEDHSLVAELVRSGKLSPEEAETHPQRSVITRALGTDPDVDVDAFSVETKPGDVFLLCSDGLTTMVTDETILRAVEDNRHDLKAAVRALVNAANRRGGEDNITVVCFEISEDAGETARVPAVGGSAAAVSEDEDTLSGTAAPTTVDTMVVPAERVDEWLQTGEHAAPERPAPPPHGTHRALWALVGLAVVAGIAALVVWLLSRQHFIGAAGNHVAVYQGVPWILPAGLHLYRTVYVSPLLVSQLSQAERARLFDHNLVGERDALAAIRPFERDVTP